MTFLFKVFFENPHKHKKEKLLEDIKRYNQLSNDAVELGDYEAYRAVQSKMKEAYLEFLAASFCDSMIFILPHVLIMWLLSLKYRYISFGDIKIEVIVWYPLCILMYYIGKKVFCKYNKLFKF